MTSKEYRWTLEFDVPTYIIALFGIGGFFFIFLGVHPKIENEWHWAMRLLLIFGMGINMVIVSILMWQMKIKEKEIWWISLPIKGTIVAEKISLLFENEDIPSKRHLKEGKTLFGRSYSIEKFHMWGEVATLKITAYKRYGNYYSTLFFGPVQGERRDEMVGIQSKILSLFPSELN